MYVVSACLLGDNCKYNGGNNDTPQVRAFLEGKHYLAICPEVLGGLPVPRPAAELREGRVYNREGLDVTEQFQAGALETLSLARKEAERLGEPVEGAILQARSPSCGFQMIYDGSFSGKLIPGNGITAALFLEEGIPVVEGTGV